MQLLQVGVQDWHTFTCTFNRLSRRRRRRLAWLARSTASHRWTTRSRIVSAAATNQSRSVATDASLPSSSVSLASTALLISSTSPFSAGAIAGRIRRSPPSVRFALAGLDLRANLDSSMPMRPMPLVPKLTDRALTGFQKLRFMRTGAQPLGGSGPTHHPISSCPAACGSKIMADLAISG
jgi:hypothetical protein